ncbi:MAG: pyruvate dehydrogenase (acetyl-transferring), homodimeric type, partial [Armatimonadetes bacterium]
LGEGLQHQDGHSHVLASVVPTCQAYDPAFAYEVATIIESGLHRMYGDNDDVYYYLTLYNENYIQPAMPEGSRQGIIDGLYRFDAGPGDGDHAATILFSGPSQGAARAAQVELSDRFGVSAELWSVTSYKNLREEALAVDRWNRLNPTLPRRTPFVTEQLNASRGPIVAVTDYMRMVPDQIAPYVPRTFTSLGTDGFGRSDTREALRDFFETDMRHVVVATLASLASEGAIPPDVVSDAIAHYGIDPDVAPPWTR